MLEVFHLSTSKNSSVKEVRNKMLNLFINIEKLRATLAVQFYTPVRPSTIACERDILKTACRIDFTF